MSVYFISDLHLSQERPHISELFLRFLRHHLVEAEALYILGDLFEVWLGDDMILPAYQPAIAQLAETVRQGIPVYVMYGNRDFLMRTEFERISGAKILPEPYLLNLYGKPTLLMHGDTLCTDDVEYQKFRAMVRNATWQDEMLAKTPEERLELARRFREQSKTETAGKSSEIMDVNPAEVQAVMQQYQVNDLIHGHTHRPAMHEFELAGQPARRIVLADWYTHGAYLKVDDSGYQMCEFND